MTKIEQALAIITELRKYHGTLKDGEALATLKSALEGYEKVKAGADKWMGKFAETAKGLTAERDAAHARERLSARAYGNLCSERDALKADFEYKNEQLGAALLRAEKAEAENDKLITEVSHLQHDLLYEEQAKLTAEAELVAYKEQHER